MKDSTGHADWIEAIIMIAKHYRLEYSKENISLNSDWLKDAPLSDSLRSMARQASLTVSVIQLREQDLNVWRMPLVVQFKQGQLAVLDTIDQNGKISISYCGDKGIKSSITKEELLENISLAVVLRPSHAVSDSRIKDYIDPHDTN